MKKGTIIAIKNDCHYNLKGGESDKKEEIDIQQVFKYEEINPLVEEDIITFKIDLLI